MLFKRGGGILKGVSFAASNLWAQVEILCMVLQVQRPPIMFDLSSCAVDPIVSKNKAKDDSINFTIYADDLLVIWGDDVDILATKDTSCT